MSFMWRSAIRFCVAAVLLLAPFCAGAFPTAPFLPLATGNSWNYLQNGAFTSTTQVGSPTFINGNLAYPLTFSSDATVEYYSSDSVSGIRLHQLFDPSTFLGQCPTSETVVFSPPLVLAAPDMVVGQVANSGGTASASFPSCNVLGFPLSYSASSTVTATENLIVPAGRFDTARIVVNITLTGSGVAPQFTSTTYWVASGIGTIRQQDSDGTSELVSTNVARSTPDPFSFGSLTSQPINTVVQTLVQPGGITVPVPISVSGGEYSLNSPNAWTSAPGMVSNNQPVYVRLTSAATYNTTRTMTVTIGGVSGSFSVTTAPPAHTGTSIVGPASVAEGTTASYSLVASFADGSTQDVPATWFIPDFYSSYAAIDSSGTLTAAQVATDQTVTIIASFSASFGSGAVQRQVTVVNIPPFPVALSIIGPGSVAATVSAAYSALAKMNDGSVLPVAAVWSLTGTGATIDANGSLAAGAVSGVQVVQVSASFTAGGVTSSATRQVALLGSGIAAAYVPDHATGFSLNGNTLATPLDVAAAFGSADAPVPGVSANVEAVWTWNATTRKWRFHTPQLSAPDSAAYALANGYEVLVTVAPGEGYWVNAYVPLALPARSGSPAVQDAPAFAGLASSWNLLADDRRLTPLQFNNQLGGSIVPPQAIPENFIALWMWDASLGKWFFFAPSLVQPGAPFDNLQYCQANGYLDFAAHGRTLDAGAGFWVERP